MNCKRLALGQWSGAPYDSVNRMEKFVKDANSLYLFYNSIANTNAFDYLFPLSATVLRDVRAWRPRARMCQRPRGGASCAVVILTLVAPCAGHKRLVQL